MIVVIQCAGSKRRDAASLTTERGKTVAFVAHPELAPPRDDCVYARPDDLSDDGRSWRQVLWEYNKRGLNSVSLYPAWRLYENPVYERMADSGLDKMYVLSAGWGLLAASFLTPDYDITFSKGQRVPKFKRRQRSDRYADFSMIPPDTREAIVFFGSKDYVPLFCSLTRTITTARTVFYNSGDAPDAPGCLLKRFPGNRTTNWHYDCANAFLDGAIRGG